MTSTAPSVRITSLPFSLLKFPPSSIPATLPPPPENPTFAHPFTIPASIYNDLLAAEIPITVALVYITVVSYLNNVNAQRKYKPWSFSKTKLFRLLVIVHNVFLALYSAWTCAGMVNDLIISFAGWKTEYGLAGAVDSLCKMHGPRGLGGAATYNATSSVWGFTNRLFHLAADGLTPESTDVGRIWNEGLAFYGWLFYLSKFYEVIDTFIILAKGKKSSLLQTYHHAGAMLCMWAGIRYMAAPIWMFVLVNSGLHAIMYTYYTMTALSIKVPKWFKKTLTTLQIVQFVVGASYAFSHLFVAYQIPVSVPYLYHLGDVASSISSSISSEMSSAASVATATASAGVGAWLKKAAFRAAGREGLAENVVNELGQTFGLDAVHAVKDLKAREETRYRDELQWVHCLDTSGQVFAILLNCVYLAPLTLLFIRFFVRAYSKRQERRRSSTASEKAKDAASASRDALKGVSRQVQELGNEGAIEEDEQEIHKGRKGDVSSTKEQPSLHETPELTQDDSFVKVDRELRSETSMKEDEVKSVGDDEGGGEEEDAGASGRSWADVLKGDSSTNAQGEKSTKDDHQRVSGSKAAAKNQARDEKKVEAEDSSTKTKSGSSHVGKSKGTSTDPKTLEPQDEKEPPKTNEPLSEDFEQESLESAKSEKVEEPTDTSSTPATGLSVEEEKQKKLEDKILETTKIEPIASASASSSSLATPAEQSKEATESVKGAEEKQKKLEEDILEATRIEPLASPVRKSTPARRRG